MATYIENQPVYFYNTTPSCPSEDDEYKQRVDLTDNTQFQFQLDSCTNAATVIADGTFPDAYTTWTLGTNWSIATNLLCCTGAVGTASAVNTFQFTSTKYYKVVITCSSMSAGGSIEVLLGATLLGYITTTGTHTFYGFPTAFFGNYQLILASFAAGTEACFSEAEAYEVKLNNKVAIFDTANTYITEISYNSNPTYFHVNNGYMTVTIDWSALLIPAGCYYLCWMDACTNTNGQNYPPVMLNCDFEDPLPLKEWTHGTFWSGSGGEAIGASTSGIASDYELYQDNIFPDLDSTYCLTIIVSSMTSGAVKVYFGTALIQTITAAGTYEICAQPVATNRVYLYLADNTNISISSICPTTITGTDYTCNMTSNVFNLGDYSNTCTLLLSMYDTKQSLGFDFDATYFTPSVRIEARLRQSNYKSERLTYKNSKGRRMTAYFDATKYKNLVTEQLPEYIHDFLRLLCGVDIFLIDSVEYYVEDDEYNVVRDKSQDEMGSVSLLVAKNGQNIKNNNCVENQNDCTLSENLLLLESGESISL